MIAKVIWNIANTVSGMLPFTVATAIPARKLLSQPPYQTRPSATGIATTANAIRASGSSVSR